MVSLDEFCLNTGLWPEWYAIRVFYNRVGPLKETLDNAAISYFYPMHLVEKCSDGGIIYVQEPLIKALVFAKTTASDLETSSGSTQAAPRRTTTRAPEDRSSSPRNKWIGSSSFAP